MGGGRCYVAGEERGETEREKEEKVEVMVAEGLREGSKGIQDGVTPVSVSRTT